MIRKIRPFVDKLVGFPKKETPQYMTPFGIPKIGKRDFCPFLRIFFEKNSDLKVALL
jgi:hypothetical protein